MLDALKQVSTFILGQFTNIWAAYTGEVLCVVIALWVLDRLLHIFDVLKR